MKTSSLSCTELLEVKRKMLIVEVEVSKRITRQLILIGIRMVGIASWFLILLFSNEHLILSIILSLITSYCIISIFQATYNLLNDMVFRYRIHKGLKEIEKDIKNHING